MSDDFIVHFRDGRRRVAPYIEAMLKDAGIETHRYTYKEAIREADNRRLGDVLHRHQQHMIDAHFKEQM